MSNCGIASNGSGVGVGGSSDGGSNGSSKLPKNYSRNRTVVGWKQGITMNGDRRKFKCKYYKKKLLRY